MNRDFSSLAGKHFDLLVCGGGIYGAWTAYDAALRGLSVAIVEQGDWAGATSSASSKPPCISLLDADEVALAQSPCSTIATLSPRKAAS